MKEELWARPQQRKKNKGRVKRRSRRVEDGNDEGGEGDGDKAGDGEEEVEVEGREGGGGSR